MRGYFVQFLSHSRSRPEVEDETHNANLQRKAYHLKYFEVLFLCCISKKNYRQEKQKEVMTIFFLKITSNHIRLSLKKSMDLNEEKALSLIFCCSKLKRRRLPSITFKIIPWAIDWGCYSLFLDIKKMFSDLKYFF